MYVPPAFREEDPREIQRVLREFSFATLVTGGEAGITASHLPLLFDAERGPRGVLRGHFARANPQWRELDPTCEVLAIFSGPHAYISPTWYATKPAVPTWNYVAVHAYGRPRLITDEAELRQLLADATAYYEPAGVDAWRMESLPGELLSGLTRAVVGFEIELSRLEGKWKLNQNRSAADQRGAAAGLRETGEPGSVQMAEWMERRLLAE